MDFTYFKQAMAVMPYYGPINDYMYYLICLLLSKQLLVLENIDVDNMCLDKDILFKGLRYTFTYRDLGFRLTELSHDGEYELMFRLVEDEILKVIPNHIMNCTELKTKQWFATLEDNLSTQLCHLHGDKMRNFLFVEHKFRTVLDMQTNIDKIKCAHSWIELMEDMCVQLGY